MHTQGQSDSPAPAPSRGLPTVSVVLATRNRADSLARALDSLAGQDYPADHWEVIVVDDGSADHTPDVVRQRADGSFPVPLRYAHQEPSNVAVARERGRLLAGHTLVALTDDDCTFPPDWLRRLTAPLADPAVGAAGGTDRAPAQRSAFCGAVDYAFGSLLGTGGVRGGNGRRVARFCPRGCNMVMRRSAVAQVGGFDPRFFNGEEIDLDYRLRHAGYRLAFAPACEVIHHRRATWRSLWRQIVGRGETRILLFRTHPRRFEPAYLAPLAVGMLVPLLAVAAAISPAARPLLAAALTAYALLLAAGGLHALLTRRRPREALLVPPVLAVVHAAYAAGLWRGIIRRPARAAATPPRPLRVLISNDGFGPNLGDRAILACMQEDLRATFPGVEIRGFLNAWRPAPPDLLRLRRDMRWADCFLLGGGQVLHDHTSFCFLLAALLKLAAARHYGAAAIVYGAGVGPIRTRAGRRLARAILNRADLVLVRDRPSAALLRELGVTRPPVEVFADSAFRLPDGPVPAGLDDLPAPRVAICPRRWFHYRHHLLPARWRPRRLPPAVLDRQNALLDALAFTARTVLDQGGSVLLVAMKRALRDWDPGQDDDRFCRELAARLGGESPRLRVLAAAEPGETAAALGRMQAILTMRMHAAILGAARGVPAVGLALSDKFTACFASLGQAHLLAEPTEADGRRLAALLERALARGEDERAALRHRAEAAAADSACTVARLAAWVRQRLPAIQVKETP